ncbi:hypothetical protein DXH47_10755 [Levilactobacillus suantsaii]|uniref:Uncharacterized protein n=1 Tax=Levilactobacillus suantsaii TaxID=2292255 RepID=A0A4Q0VH90_9LACO|nr:hypothetical protein DXH47_10755 [Levilactobacillus suantsaii]
MVRPIKSICIFLVSLLLSLGSTIFLAASLLVKAILFLIFMIVNIIAISDFSKLKNLKAAMADDIKKSYIFVTKC